MAINSSTKYFVALSREPKIGARTFLKLLHVFSKIENVWKATSVDFQKKGIPESISKLIITLKNKVDPDSEMEKLAKSGVRVVTILDESYPRLLKEIPDPPALLYVRGEFKPSDDLSIAVVGSRNYTFYGKQVTETITKPLAEAGLSIISGLALGVDTFAHKTTLEVKNARTIGVLACGLDQIYPSTNRFLAEKIIDGRGAIISEFPLGMPALPYNFPVRNRIIAGLSLGVVVIEASIKSGSFLTARSALEYNREVFAVPGSIFSERSAGANNLIKMGAKLVTCASDVLEELNIEAVSEINSAKNILPDTKEESILLKILSKSEPVHINQIMLKSGLDIAAINSVLVMMEMKGKVKNLGGNQYIISS